MNLEDAGEVIVEHFPELAGTDKVQVAREFFEKNPDYWGYLSKTMEAFRQALAKRSRVHPVNDPPLRERQPDRRASTCPQCATRGQIVGEAETDGHRTLRYRCDACAHVWESREPTTRDDDLGSFAR